MNWLVTAEFQYNNKKHAATGKTPLEGEPHSPDRHSTSRRFPHWITKEL